MWLPYVLMRELYLQSIRDHVANRSSQQNWSDCHVTGGSVFPNIPGC